MEKLVCAAIPYTNVKERIRITKEYEKEYKVEILDKFILVSVRRKKKRWRYKKNLKKL